MKHRKSPLRVQLPVVLASLLALSSAEAAISFVNPDLEGTATLTVLPTGWSQVPITAPYTDSDFSGGETTDTVSLTGPNVGLGFYGTPHTGNTFVGAMNLFVTSGGFTYQEGLEQTVGGFTIGEQYSFSFFQAVAVSNSAQDSSGSWQVYANETLVTTTAASSTSVLWNTPDKPLEWEQRTITFTANAESIKFSFLAKDDDGNITNGANGVYMGIDSFSDIVPVPEPSAAALGLIGVLGLLRRRRA